MFLLGGVGVGVGIDISRPESESEPESLEIRRLRCPGRNDSLRLQSLNDGQSRIAPMMYCSCSSSLAFTFGRRHVKAATNSTYKHHAGTSETGGRAAEWSGEPVSHPATVQDGGFASRRCQTRDPPYLRGFGERECAL